MAEKLTPRFGFDETGTILAGKVQQTIQLCDLDTKYCLAEGKKKIIIVTWKQYLSGE